MPKRRNFKEFIKNIGDEKAKQIALDRAYGDNTVTIAYLAKKYEISENFVRKTIEHVIVTPNLITNEEAHLIEQRSSLNQSPHTQKAETVKTKSYYNRLFQERERNKHSAEDLASLIKERDLIKFQLDSFEDFVSSDQEVEFQKKALQKKLSMLEKLIEEKSNSN